MAIFAWKPDYKKGDDQTAHAFLIRTLQSLLSKLSLGKFS